MNVYVCVWMCMDVYVYKFKYVCRYMHLCRYECMYVTFMQVC